MDRFFLSVALILTGIHRFNLTGEIKNEHDRLFPELPLSVIYIIPLFEIVSGLLIWSKYMDIVLYTWITFVCLFTFSIFIRKRERDNVIKSYKDIFTYKSTMPSVTLHLFWIVIILKVIGSGKK
jgi:uncharacterized membrane protein